MSYSKDLNKRLNRPRLQVNQVFAKADPIVNMSDSLGSSFVACCSVSELKHLKPDEQTTIVRITDTVEEGLSYSEEFSKGWKAFYYLKMRVYSTRTSFQECDEQARRIGRHISPIVPENKSDVRIIFVCDHGEIRSKCLAFAVSIYLGLEVMQIDKGEVSSADFNSDTFTSRTIGIVIDEL